MKNSVLSLCLFIAVQAVAAPINPPVTIRGVVRDNHTNAPLAGATVLLTNQAQGVATDAKGQFMLTVAAADSMTLAFSHVGYETIRRTVHAAKAEPLVVTLTPGKALTEVVIRSVGANRTADESAMGQLQLTGKQLRTIPALFGEKDVMRALQLMPGIQKGGEGNTGIYVRGGGPDQNLTLLDDATIYNASHLFGFFSVFNGDVVRNVNLTKGGFGARHGGRLSSVIDVETRDGNMDKVRGEGGIGLLSSRFMLEGPLQSGKASFMVAGRRTYVDLLTSAFLRTPETAILQGYNFYDLNGKLTLSLGERDRLSITGYTGRDQLRGTDDEQALFANNMGWGNDAASLRWSHYGSARFSSVTALTFSNYRFRVTTDGATADSSAFYQLRYVSAVRDLGVKHTMTIKAGESHELRAGGQLTYHLFTPSATVAVKTDAAVPTPASDPSISAFEGALFLDDTWQPSAHWTVQPGIRLSAYQQGTVRYINPEPRLLLTYTPAINWSATASYTRMNQYVHLLSNGGSGLPADLWIPSTANVAPQQADQIALGLTKGFADRALTLTVEGYYKTMRNLIHYREGNSFLRMQHPGEEETDWSESLTTGRGWSYGAEVLLKKSAGAFTGWLGYTLSWTLWQFADLNAGKAFFPRYDRRHDLSLVGSYAINENVTLSTSWVYGTGNALTMPIARYRAYEHQPDQLGGINPASQFGPGKQANDYGTKNSFRAEPYHRLDLSLQLRRKLATRERIWEFSVYNAYNRRNTFYYQMTHVPATKGSPERAALKRYSLFPVLPSVSYLIKF